MAAVWQPAGLVTAVSGSPTHTFSKPQQAAIRLLAGLGVEGDAHLGVTVKHRSRVARDPTQPNLRQVHLIHAELHDELRAAGFGWARTRSSRSPASATPACSSTTTRTGCWQLA